MTLNFRIKKDITTIAFAIGINLEQSIFVITFIYWSFVVIKVKDINDIKVKL